MSAFLLYRLSAASFHDIGNTLTIIKLMGLLFIFLGGVVDLTSSVKVTMLFFLK